MRALLKPGHARQPTLPVQIDITHPLGRFITASIDATNGGQLIPYETITGIPATGVASPPNNEQMSDGAVGYGYATTNGFTGGAYWPAAPKWGNAASGVNFSVEFLMTKNPALTNAGARVLDFGNTGGWDIERNNGGGIDLGVWNGGTQGGVGFTAALTTHFSYHLVCTFIWVSANTWNITTYVNGVVFANSASTTMTTAGKANFIWANSSTTSGLSSPDITLHYAHFYQGYALTGTDVLSLFRDPWQVYAAPRGLSLNSIITPFPVGAQSYPYIA